MSKDGKKNKWSSGPKNKWSSGPKSKGSSTPKNKYAKKAQFKPPNKKGRIIIRNIPYKATEDTIRAHFAKFGDIREINLLKRPDGNPVGCGFVQYNNEENAAEAIKKCSGKELLGRKITVDWAMQQAFYIVNRPDQPQAEGEEEGEETNEPEMDQTVDLEDDTNNYESEEKYDTEVKEEDEGFEIVPSTNPAKIKARKEKRKRSDLLKKQKKGRIIVRNLPFKVTEDSLRQHFSEYGSLSEVTILRKPDGRLVGCGFIQFESIKNASKAILKCSGKPLLGRPIVLDWAVAKSAYQAKIAPPDVKIKEEPEDDYKYSLDATATLDDSNDTDPDTDIKSESDSEEEDTKDFKEEDSDFKEEKFDNDDEDEDIEEPKAKRPRVISNDVSEGKTVFIKNVPFSANNADLKSCMEQFGPVVYALICVDRMTEHSKGSAFVKFKNVESAQKCLAAGTELTLNTQVLDPHPALNRGQVGGKAAAKDLKVAKDNRNLFLVKEGVILAGSPAAAGLSVADMSKRLQLEQWKSQMLRNLNMFVSRDRLAVHNIPPSYDDAKLRELFQRETGPNAVITEARVMRDKKNFDANGVGVSKGTGFVKFTAHEDALQALRSINNNPNIFSKAKRPIVAFAIENRAIHKVRQQRELKSKAKNPTSASYTGPVSSSVPGPSSVPGKKFMKGESRRQRRAKERPTTAPQAEDFSGLAAAPGNKGLRPKHKLKAQAELHLETVRKNKVKAKAQQRIVAQRLVQEKPIKQPKQKKGKGKQLKEDGTFSKLVNNYVSKIAASTEGKKKWYEEKEAN